jgi:hypothetical protein
MKILTNQQQLIVAKKVKQYYKTETASGVRAGIYCIFVPLNRRWGVKCYQSRRIGRIAFEDQKLAHEHGVAPRVKHQFDLVVPGTNKSRAWYCFVTQRATHVGNCCYLDEADEQGHVEDLKTALGEIGLDHLIPDLHDDNIGFLCDKLVCIDFSYSYGKIV